MGCRRSSSSQPRSVSGRWNENTGRLAGSGSSLLVNRVSVPVDSRAERQPRPRRPVPARRVGRRRYLALWCSTPVRSRLPSSCLDDSGRATIEKQQVVGAAVRRPHHELAHRDAPRATRFTAFASCTAPPPGQHPVDLDSGAGFGIPVGRLLAGGQHQHIFASLTRGNLAVQRRRYRRVEEQGWEKRRGHVRSRTAKSLARGQGSGVIVRLALRTSTQLVVLGAPMLELGTLAFTPRAFVQSRRSCRSGRARAIADTALTN